MSVSEELFDVPNDNELRNIIDDQVREEGGDDEDTDLSQPSPPKRVRGSEANSNAEPKNREKTAWKHFKVFTRHYL